jgi:hypothetical protein
LPSVHVDVLGKEIFVIFLSYWEHLCLSLKIVSCIFALGMFWY